MGSSGGTGAPTLHDVAREAGVSLATASRVLNGSARVVAEAYRERVTLAADQLGYTTNLSAQAVAKGTSSIVSLVVPDIADPYFSQIAAGVTAEAEAAGLVVSVSVTGRDAERELQVIRTLRGQRPRVLILAGSRRTEDPMQDALAAELESYTRLGGTVAVIGSNDLGYATARVDNRAAARELALHVAGLGYRRVAAVVGPQVLVTSADRLGGFQDGLAEHGAAIADEHVIVSDFSRDGGYDGMQRLLAAGIDGAAGIELVFAASDVMAMGVMSALRDAGIEPGTGIAVCGFDDIPTVRDVTPALTTVRIPLERLGRTALRLALGDDSATASSETPSPAPATLDATSAPATTPADQASDIASLDAEVVLRASTPPLSR
ncbi:LacI family DNA-binding transcriptional regulator [Plantibacter sp. YIM 135249]|uniref:LacI family DNA-binding transcriptional regulator n=1 Tax=Plantibacter sp. YIM 135249 TaxID=3423918 RepID=UPI003D354D11